MARRSFSRNSKGTKLLNFWAPEQLIQALSSAVVVCDTDKSKFIRAAIREKAARAGIEIREAA